jgi:hypothetical protein
MVSHARITQRYRRGAFSPFQFADQQASAQSLIGTYVNWLTIAGDRLLSTTGHLNEFALAEAGPIQSMDNIQHA